MVVLLLIFVETYKLFYIVAAWSCGFTNCEFPTSLENSSCLCLLKITILIGMRSHCDLDLYVTAW